MNETDKLILVLGSVGLAALIVYGGTLLHELAHAWVARAVGYRCDHIVVGEGVRMLQFSLGGIRIELRAVLIGGGGAYVVGDGDPKTARMKNIWVYAAGPLTTICVAVTCLLLSLIWIHDANMLKKMFGAAFLYGGICEGLAVLAGLTMTRISVDEDVVNTDGFHLRRLIWGGDAAAAFYAARDRIYGAKLSENVEGWKAPIAMVVTAGRELSVPLAEYELMAWALFQGGHLSAARRLLDETQPDAQEPFEERRVLLSVLCDVVRNQARSWTTHLHNTSALIRKAPGNTLCRVLRGAVLYHVGKSTEAITILESVMKEIPQKGMEAVMAHEFLGRIAREAGNEPKAKDHEAAALAADEGSGLLIRMRAGLADITEA